MSANDSRELVARIGPQADTDTRGSTTSLKDFVTVLGRMTERAHLHITGRVQGVGFRASTRREATANDLSGWVKNLADGRVEAVFEGPKSDVKAMVEWCHTGPQTATVEDVTVEYEDPTGLDGFEIRR